MCTNLCRLCLLVQGVVKNECRNNKCILFTVKELCINMVHINKKVTVVKLVKLNKGDIIL